MYKINFQRRQIIFSPDHITGYGQLIFRGQVAGLGLIRKVWFRSMYKIDFQRRQIILSPDHITGYGQLIF